jgi:hypothetical protein
VIDSVGLDRAKVNPMGGAIALGHPLGATGAIRSATVVHALRRQQPEVRHGRRCASAPGRARPASSSASELGARVAFMKLAERSTACGLTLAVLAADRTAAQGARP